MARDIDKDDEDTPEKDAAAAAETVSKVSGDEKDPTDGLKMNVAEDGTVTFGESDARGEKTAKVGDDDDEDHEDPNLSDPEREALRARRRDEKKRRREAQRQRENELRGQNASLQQTVQDLVGRLQQVEQRTSTIDVARLDEELRGAAYAANAWKAEFEAAVAKADGPGAAAAMEQMQKAQREGERLFATKQAFIRSVQQPQQRGIHPEVQKRVDTWRARHSWYNPANPDLDTRIALAVDADVAKDGFNPATDEFWEELDRRLSSKLPERYTDDGDSFSGASTAAGGRANSAGGSRSSPPNRRVPASGGGSAGGSTQASFTLSAERVQALKDAGMWNDPKKRETAIRNFMQYDRQHKARS